MTKLNIMDAENKYMTLVKRINGKDRMERVYVIKDEAVAKKIRLKKHRGTFMKYLAERGYTFSDYQFKPGRNNKDLWFLRLES